MNSVNLITLSNECQKEQSFINEKECNKIGTVGSIMVTIFLGATLLNGSSDGIVNSNVFSNPPYIQCINIENDSGDMNLYTGNSVDLLKVENLNKISKMSAFEEDWNGTGGSSFSEEAIHQFTSIINALDKQPQIAPTGRNTLLMQYELCDKSLLAFEVGENRVDKVYIPHGDYSKAQVETFTECIAEKMKESVKVFYGFK